MLVKLCLCEHCRMLTLYSVLVNNVLVNQLSEEGKKSPGL